MRFTRKKQALRILKTEKIRVREFKCVQQQQVTRQKGQNAAVVHDESHCVTICVQQN